MSPALESSPHSATGQSAPAPAAVANAASRLSDRALVILTCTFLAALSVAVIVALLVWRTPALHPVPVPLVAGLI